MAKLTNKKSRTKTPSKITAALRHTFLEVFFILSIVVSVYILLSLWTYSINSIEGFEAPILMDNAGGRAGAYLSNGFFSVVGYVAYLIPFCLSYSAFLLIKSAESVKLKLPSVLIKLIGLLLTSVSFCGMSSLIGLSFAQLLPKSGGGTVGLFLAKSLYDTFDLAGAFVILLGGVLIGFTLVTKISWIIFIEGIGRYASQVAFFLYSKLEFAYALVRKSAENISQWNENRIKANQLKVKAQAKVKAKAQAEAKAQTKAQVQIQSQVASQEQVQTHAQIESQEKIQTEVQTPAQAQMLVDEQVKVQTLVTPQEQTPITAPVASAASALKKCFSRKSTPKINSNVVENDKLSTSSFEETAEIKEVDPYLKDDFFGTPPSKISKVNVTEPYKKNDNNPPPIKNKNRGALPSLSLLSKPVIAQTKRFSSEELEMKSREVEQKLLDFGVNVTVVAVHPGPVITRFELELAPGLKVSKITALGKDLARSLSVIGVRVVEVIPGKSVVGLELPNEQRDMVVLSEVLSTDVYDKCSSPLTLALGVDIAGAPMVVNLAKMPHLLVAGTTGSGKSVGINAMLLSLLFKATPEEVRLIMVDPKMLELSVYDGIPHLLTPVVTDMKDAARALRWCVMEMERRYKLMAALGVRNIAGFNKKVKDAISNGDPIQDPLWQGLESDNAPPLTSLPSIVVVIDELADMMMVVGKKVEQLIARIAQKARAAGIHLILATQRPSVDVLTGLIKSNIPTRIAFQVSSKIDSRTILDQGGADQLLGHGDMLYLAPGSGAPIRVHGAFVDDNEVHRVASAWRELGEPNYIDDITNSSSESDDFNMDGGSEAENEVDALYDAAIEFVTQARKASISSVQRRFKIGYNRAARLVEEMERTGVVGPMEGGSRDVLAPPPPSESGENS